MGTVRLVWHRAGIADMRFLLVLALAASARGDATADPAFFYSTGGVPVPLAAQTPLTYAHVPLTYTAPTSYILPGGCQNAQGSAVPCNLAGAPLAVAPAAAQAAPQEGELRSPRERQVLSQQLKLILRLTPGFTTVAMATPTVMATPMPPWLTLATMEATTPTPTPTTMATMAGRKGMQRLNPRQTLRQTPGTTTVVLLPTAMPMPPPTPMVLTTMPPSPMCWEAVGTTWAL